MLNEVWASRVVLVVKNLPANAGDARDVGSIPGSGRSHREGNGNPEEPLGLQFTGSQKNWAWPSG